MSWLRRAKATSARLTPAYAGNRLLLVPRGRTQQHALLSDAENSHLLVRELARLHQPAQLLGAATDFVVGVDEGIEVDRDHRARAQEREAVERLARSQVCVLHEVARFVRTDR